MSQTETPDIVEYLTETADCCAEDGNAGIAAVMKLAAVEIERLRESAKGQLVVVRHAQRLREEAEAEASRLRSELARTKRNRDMWKDQCGRQAERLTQAGVMARFYASDEHWRLNGRCDPNSARFEGPNIAAEYLRFAGRPLPSPPGENE